MTTVCVFLGTAALAPFSMTTAFALDGDNAAGFGVTNTQSLRGTDAPLAALDTSVEATDGNSASAPSIGAAAGLSKASPAEYSLEEFLFSGVVNWSGYRFTFYSQQVLPGPGLAIPGRHVNAGGFVADEDGFIVLAGDHPKGTVFETPFGYPGKIYDRGTFGNHLDVYIR